MPFIMKKESQNKIGVLFKQYQNANEARKLNGLRSEEFIGIVEEMRDIEREMFKIILRDDIFDEIPKCRDDCWCKKFPRKQHDSLD